MIEMYKLLVLYEKVGISFLYRFAFVIFKKLFFGSYCCEIFKIIFMHHIIINIWI